MLTRKKHWHGLAAATMCLLIYGCGNDAEFASAPPRESIDAEAEPPPVEEPEEEVVGTQGDDSTIPVSPGQTGIKEPPEYEDIDVPLKTYDRVHWLWSCNEIDDPSLVTNDESEALIQNSGPHKFDQEELPDAEVVLGGNLCIPEKRRRDIVFVIDVSGSMSGNDPRAVDDCARRTSIETVMSLVPNDGSVNVGIVTFSSAATATSKLFTKLDDAYTDLTAGNIADVICAQAGGTNYQAGINAANALLTGGRKGAMKEVYLISDGQPNAGQDGVPESEAMKSPGIEIDGKKIPVTFATVMLGGTDTVLEEKIASKDSNGMPLHAFAAKANELADALSNLAKNEIVYAEMLYRAIGTRKWSQLDIMGHLSGEDYSLPPVKLKIADYPKGIEVVYMLQDRHANTFSDHGKIKWVKKTKKQCSSEKGSGVCSGSDKQGDGKKESDNDDDDDGDED